MPGIITQMTWLDDNTAIVEGKMDTGFHSIFYVYVPGDLEYEQPGLEMPEPTCFRVKAIIGRQGSDYGRPFILKLALFNADGERFAEPVRSSGSITKLMKQLFLISRNFRVIKNRRLDGRALSHG
jgi:hypothetical protein